MQLPLVSEASTETTPGKHVPTRKQLRNPTEQAAPTSNAKLPLHKAEKPQHSHQASLPSLQKLCFSSLCLVHHTGFKKKRQKQVF